MTEGRREMDIFLGDFSEEDGMATFTLKVGEKEKKAYLPLGMMAEEVGNMLLYERELYSEAPVLDYIYANEFSTISQESFSKGDYLIALDENGKKRGSFVVSQENPEALELEAINLSSPLPGIALRKKKGIEVSIAASLLLPFSISVLEAKVAFFTSVYPLIPVISAGINMDNGISPYFGVGGKLLFPLSSLWSDLPVIRNIAVEGEVDLMVSPGREGSLGGRWSIGARYSFHPSLFLSLSYGQGSGSLTRVALAFGGVI